MKIITYLAFTVLSIAIQFVVMDLIQEKLELDNEKLDLNETKTSQNKKLGRVLQKYAEKPHALYYRAQEGVIIKRQSTNSYPNMTIPDVPFETSTDFSSTVFDVLYEDNSTVSQDIPTTESIYTSTEFENVTDITIFGKKNAPKPKITPKKVVNQDCNCDLLHNICDINCCCDNDCTEYEQALFLCAKSDLAKAQSQELCYTEFSNHYLMGSNIDKLFCVVKNNLPEKRNIVLNKHDPSIFEKTFKWHSNNYNKMKPLEVFEKKQYKYGDPVWLLHNKSIFYIDLPTATVNNHCDNRKPLRFLRNEKIKCNVKITDLEILRILSTIEQTSVISITESSLNSTALNCSSLHCTNWTIILCDEIRCTNYNKSLHDPLCTENVCTDLALKVDYTFHYYDQKIMNASIKLYTQKLPLNMPFIHQEINVKFIMANESVDEIIELSGNPGYIPGLPVIISFDEDNRTEKFFNNTLKMKRYLTYPGNKNGACITLNITDNVVIFGVNKRIRCRYYHEHKMTEHNATETCENVQNNMTKLLGLDRKIFVAPFGNPAGLSDKTWLPLEMGTPDALLYGELSPQQNRIHCYNMKIGSSLLFTFAETSTELSKKDFKILSAKVDTTVSNVTLNVEEISTVITIDTIFIDETKPSVFEYAGAPQLNIHLPKDFFFPFPSKAHNLAIKVDVLIGIIIMLIVK